MRVLAFAPLVLISCAEPRAVDAPNAHAEADAAVAATPAAPSAPPTPSAPAAPVAAEPAPEIAPSVSASATAAAEPPPSVATFKTPSNLPAAWTDCTKDTCTMIRNECCDAWSVTHAHAAEAQTEMNQRRSRAMKGVRPGASPCRRSCASPGTPTCESGQCVFAR